MARICRDIQWKDVVLSKEFGPREVIGYNSEKTGDGCNLKYKYFT